MSSDETYFLQFLLYKFQEGNNETAITENVCVVFGTNAVNVCKSKIQMEILLLKIMLLRLMTIY